ATRRKARPAAAKKVAARRKPAAGGAKGKAGRYVYFFGAGKAEGRAEMRNLLGGKGANLAEMAGLGLPVPPGFTLSTDVCTYYYANGRKFPPELKDQVTAALRSVEEHVGSKFGDATSPLLLSCRSGARDSMP